MPRALSRSNPKGAGSRSFPPFRPVEDESRRWEYAPGCFLHNVHAEEVCQVQPCIIHCPTDHHMRGWLLHFRGDRGIFERICEHGVGHPDPDQYAFWTHKVGVVMADAMRVHGCDGCCQRSD